MGTLTPRAVTVRVGSSPLADAQLRRLVSVRVATRLDQPAQCEITLAADAGPAADPGLFPLGAALVIGLSGVGDDLFTGEVTACEIEYAGDGSVLLRARGYDPLHRLRKRQELRVFESVTTADLAGQLVDGTGLSVDADEEGPRIERLLQHRHTDFDLLAEVAGRAGLHFAADGDTLRLFSLDGYGSPVGLELGASVLSLRVAANLDQAIGSSAALGWNTRTAEVITQTAESPRTGRSIDLRPDADDVGGGGTRTAVDQPGRSDDELAALAQARLDARAAAWVTVSGIAEGDVELRAGRRISVSGTADSVAGVYVLTEAVHTIDAAGHLTRFSTEPPPAPPAPPAAALITLGTVTDIDDPDQLGRVRVDLPAYGGLDAGWLGVVFPGSGHGKGIIALPDPDDTVLVALPGGEPAAGIVLGALFGAIEPYDAGIDGGKAKRWTLRTANGQAIVLDDGGRRLRLENEAGSFFEITPDLATLHAATDLVVEAPGKAMTIRANTVDFQHAS
ncbi:phage baseplate assembly protein V [Hamadaea tsunoensis]|uniref:phage baseplate assembly protein V n=1 Tax=Hamadaea tsunoensis TaxID=53368 RepID=UPI0003F80CFD|nr:phage baseplate assembly protein V [Hamadaea tsunoensis]